MPEILERSERLNREKDGEIDSFIIEVPAEKIRVNEAKTLGAVAVGVDAKISKSDNVKGEVEGVDPVDDGDWYGQDGGTDVSVRAPHLLANYKVKDARLWIKLPSAKRKTLL